MHRAPHLRMYMKIHPITPANRYKYSIYNIYSTTILEQKKKTQETVVGTGYSKFYAYTTGIDGPTDWYSSRKLSFVNVVSAALGAYP